MSSEAPKRSLFEELKRRHVWRVATVYGAGAFIAWQVADIAFPALGLPDTAMTWVVVLAIAGFPIAIGLAWVFQLTGEGVKRTSQLDALDPVERARDVRPPSPAGRIATVATLTVAVLLGTWAVTDRLGLLEGEPEISHTALAVLPFNVLGSESLTYLREGMVDLLSRALDGVGDLKTIDPGRVTKATAAEATLDEDGAVVVARRIGAGQFVTGSIAEAGGQLRISASLYALQDSVVALSKSEVQGEATELFSLIDRLTGDLLAGRSLGAASESMVRSAALSTRSLPALKAFLEGETLFRKAEFDSANQAFGRAIEADTSFATAYYRRAVANGFRREFPTARSQLATALEHSDAMSEHDRRLAAAYNAYMNGELDDAVDRYERVLRDYPEDLEAKVHLGSVLMDRNPFRGEPLTKARELLTEVLEVDPEYQCSLCELMTLAYQDRDWDAFERYLKISHAKNSEGDTTLHLNEKLLLARARGQSAEVERLLLVVDTLTDDAALNRLHNVAHSVQSLFGDVRLQRILLEARQQREQRFPEFSHAFEWLFVERSEGHMAKSLEYVRQLGRVERDDHTPLIQQQMPYLLNLDPDLAIPVEQLEETLAYLEQLPPGVLHHDDEEERVAAEALWEPLRRYYLGLTHSRLGAAADAESDAATLDGMVAELPEYAGVIERWARTIRADVAYREGAWQRVVELVDSEAAPVKPELIIEFLRDVEIFARVRYTDALLELGRYREALRWLDHGPYNFWDTGLWVAFTSERSAHAHEALGEVDEAIADYQRFIDTWIDADPELQPRVEAAKKRISELVSARG